MFAGEAETAASRGEEQSRVRLPGRRMARASASGAMGKSGSGEPAEILLRLGRAGAVSNGPVLGAASTDCGSLRTPLGGS